MHLAEKLTNITCVARPLRPLKALVAGATAVAVSFAGTTVATAEENADQTPTAPASAENTAPQAPADDQDQDQDQDKEEGSSTGDIKAEEITAWIGVFTAVIGALGTLFGFLNKYFDLF